MRSSPGESAETGLRWKDNFSTGMELCTSLGNKGASASNLPILPSLNVSINFFNHSCSFPFSESNIGCMSCGIRGQTAMISKHIWRVPILQSCILCLRGEQQYWDHGLLVAAPRVTCPSRRQRMRDRAMSSCSTVHILPLPKRTIKTLKIQIRTGLDETL